MRSGNEVPLSKTLLKRSAHFSEKSDDMVDEVKMFPELISEVLDRGHDVRFSAPGRSMYPTIKEDETITVQPVTPLAVQKGDIILYRWEKGVIAHRIVGIEKTNGGASRFILRGDASGAQDEWVMPEQVMGKVVTVDRGRRCIDLCSTQFKIEHMLRAWASLLKWWLLRNIIRHA